LNAPTSTYLSDLSAALPVPHITGHLSHVAEIAHDLAKASGSQAQGVRSGKKSPCLSCVPSLHLETEQRIF
jgi:hypothetical protein